MKSDLARLCDYYLECLSYEQDGLSLPRLDAGHGSDAEPPYVELPDMPKDGVLVPGREAQEFLKSGLQERSRQDPVIGWPLLLRRPGRTYQVEPVLLFRVEEAGDGDTDCPRLAVEPPVVNIKALAELQDDDDGNLPARAARLENRLGLDRTEGVPGPDEIMRHLREFHPEWPWIRDRAPGDPDAAGPLASLIEEGLHDRAVLAMLPRATYTRALERELKALAGKTESQIRGTALGDWLSGASFAPDGGPPAPLLDVPPLNGEQREAVRNAFRSRLTVVTGPPGTGKSQLVCGLVINSAWSGRRILLSSRNNKAVDVVESRVNGYGPRPVLLRTGSSDHRRPLAGQLVSLLEAAVSPEDRESFRENRARHLELAERAGEASCRIASLVALRNRISLLEREAERARSAFPDIPASLDGTVLEEADRAAGVLLECLDALDRLSASVFARMLIMPFLLPRRLAAADRAARDFASVARILDPAAPEPLSAATVPDWRRYAADVTAASEILRGWTDYRDALDRLGREPLGDLHRGNAEAGRRHSEQSLETWRSWIATEPDRRPPGVREYAHAHGETLAAMTEPGDRGFGELDWQAYRATLDAVEHFDAWATTSLSARNRFPFRPGLFDLVVIDEASQCDIASALPLLYRARRAVIIGDPHQLRPISSMPAPVDAAALRWHGLAERFPGWSYGTCSLFDLAHHLAPPESRITLLEHHRSHPAIIGFSNSVFYKDRLRIVTSREDLRMPRTRAPTPPLSWIDCPGHVTRLRRSGARNKPEARKVHEVVRGLVIRSGYDGTVGVVTPFRLQAETIREMLNDDEELCRALGGRGITVETAHRFQGDERDVMVLSPVLSNGMPDGADHFLRTTPNLFNVAVTRARAMLLVVGDRSRFRESRGHLGLFERHVRDVESRFDGSPDGAALPDDGHGPGDDPGSHWRRLLCEALNGEGIHPVARFPVGDHVLALAVIDGDRKLDIEIDGGGGAGGWTDDDSRRAQLHDEHLFRLGWDVKRFWIHQLRDALPACVRSITDWAGAGPGRDQSPPDPVRPAVSPARRPNTEPDIRPAPPG